MNIPRNISISLEQNDLLATWEKPISPFHEECFEYEFYLINLKSGNKQVIAPPASEIIQHSCPLQLEFAFLFSSMPFQSATNHPQGTWESRTKLDLFSLCIWAQNGFYHLENAALRICRKNGGMRHFPGIFPGILVCLKLHP